MIAVDTNVVIRLLVGDDAGQSEQAVELFRRETIFLATSVLLEAEWVLRRGYREQPANIAHALEGLIGLPNVTSEDEAGVRQALAWHRAGMDFADALHLAAGARATAFITFDRDMIKVGRRLGLRVAGP
ncbi:MAG TPA: type II toxin-antitoxin system VapC family toxin [Rhodopila sp.]